MSAAESPHPSQNAFPQVRPDIRAWTFFPATAKRDAAYVIGREDCERFIFVPGKRLDLVQTALSRLDGTRSPEAVATEILKQKRVRMDVSDLCGKLDTAGLLTSSNTHPVSKGDIDKLSIQLGNADLSWLLRWCTRLGRFLPAGVVVALFGLTIVSALAVLVARAAAWMTGHSPVHQDLVEIHLAWNLIGILLGTIIIHEAAHLVAASYFGLKQVHGKFYLYIMVIPMVALKLRGFYTLPARGRFAVWGAGVFTNFTAASVAVLLLQWGPVSWAPILHNVVAVNWLLGITNLFPFLPTDGYYMLATLLRQMNIRVRAFAALGTLMNLRSVRPALLVILYASANVFLLAMIIFNNIRRLITGALTHHPAVYVKAAVILVGLAFILRTIWKSGRTDQSRSAPAATSGDRSPLQGNRL
jgi:Zn-dependent protease